VKRYRLATIRALLFVCLGMSLPIPVPAQTPQSYSWSTTPPNVASVTWSNQQIATFLDAITNTAVLSAISDFRFNDLDADGQLELLASVDFTGRGFFNTVVIVRRTGSAFAVQQIDTIGVDTLAGAVADLKNDGKKELLISKSITPYLGATTPQAKWTSVYGWSGPLLTDMSQQFSTYYVSSLLPTLKQTLDNLRTSQPGTLAVDIAQIQYDKTLRVSGQDPNAGLAQALIWASSTDPVYRILAASVLADIGTPTALSTLNSLTQDQNSEVAIYSQAAVQELPDLHFTRISIDIKPGDTTNPINLKSQGKIPVAILSSSTFNAPATVDTSSLTFGSIGTEHSLAFCNANGEDVNGDGLLDLVCHFDSQASSFQLGDAAGTLKGKLKDGTAIRGTDPVTVINQ